MLRRLASAAEAAARLWAAVAAALALAAVSFGGGATAQQVPELVTADTLRVCADPAAMPFSSRSGAGFENKIAAIVADELHVPLRHYWMPQGPGFVRNTLTPKLCDLVIGYAAGTELTQHSNPYYRSVYVALVRRDGPLAGLDRLADPRLEDKRIGIVAATPPADHLGDLGLLERATTYSLLVDRRFESPGDEMVGDLLAGKIDMAVLWGPIGGPLAKAHPELELVPLVHEAERPPLSFRITMAMRPNEIEWKRAINTVLRKREADINKVLVDAGVPLLDEEGNVAAAAGAKP